MSWGFPPSILSRVIPDDSRFPPSIDGHLARIPAGSAAAICERIRQRDPPRIRRFVVRVLEAPDGSVHRTLVPLFDTPRARRS